MTVNVSIEAAKLAKRGEHFGSGSWPASGEGCFLACPGRAFVGRHRRTKQKDRE